MRLLDAGPELSSAQQTAESLSADAVKPELRQRLERYVELSAIVTEAARLGRLLHSNALPSEVGESIQAYSAEITRLRMETGPVPDVVVRDIQSLGTVFDRYRFTQDKASTGLPEQAAYVQNVTNVWSQLQAVVQSSASTPASTPTSTSIPGQVPGLGSGDDRHAGHAGRSGTGPGDAGARGGVGRT